MLCNLKLIDDIYGGLGQVIDNGDNAVTIIIGGLKGEIRDT